MIRPEVFQSYEKGERKRLAIKVIGQLFDNNAFVSMTQHTAVRNYLIIQIVMHNGNRTGVIINMELQHVEKARESGPDDDGSYLIHVSLKMQS